MDQPLKIEDVPFYTRFILGSEKLIRIPDTEDGFNAASFTGKSGVVSRSKIMKGTKVVPCYD